MQEYLSLDHMKLIDDTNKIKINEKSPAYYLPHHCVLKSTSETKLRVVFDASCKSSSGISLNDVLMVGLIQFSKICYQLFYAFEYSNLFLPISQKCIGRYDTDAIAKNFVARECIVEGAGIRIVNSNVQNVGCVLFGNEISHVFGRHV